MLRTGKLPKMGLGCLELTKKNHAIIDHSIKNGIVLFDTSDCYGNNESEIALGEKLQAYDRSRLFICSKAGIRFINNAICVDGSKAYLKAACLASLQRLKTSYIDLYYLHRVDPKVLIEESVAALSELVAEGKIKHIGLSEVSAKQIRRAHAVHPIYAVQIEYSPWARQDETNDVIATCRELKIAIISYSPLGRAFFTPNPFSYFATLPQHDFRRLLPRYNSENLPGNIKNRESFQNLAAKKGCSLPQLILAWELEKGMVVIPASTNPAHLDENISALQIKLTQEEITEIDHVIDSAHFYGPRYPSAQVSAIYPEEENTQLSNPQFSAGLFARISPPRSPTTSSATAYQPGASGV